MKEQDAKSFPGTHPVVVIRTHRRHRPAAAAQRHAGGAAGLLARRSALLPPGDRSGRFHHPGLSPAKSTQTERGMRSGAEGSRTIKEARILEKIAARGLLLVSFGRRRNLLQIGDSVGFGRVFPLYGTSDLVPHARGTHAQTK